MTHQPAPLIKLTINKLPVEVDEGTTVAAAILTARQDMFRRSVSGTARGPLCGMGICFECRVTINGSRHQRSCNIQVQDGMEVMIEE